MDRFKKISVSNIRKMIKIEGLKKDKKFKGYSYKKKKELIALLEPMNISEDVLTKYRTKPKAKKPKKVNIVMDIKPIENKAKVSSGKPKEQKPKYILKHELKSGEIVEGRTFTDKAKAEEAFEKSVKKNDQHSRCFLVYKKGNKMRVIRNHRHNKNYGRNYDRAKSMLEKMRKLKNKILKNPNNKDLTEMKKLNKVIQSY